MVLLTGFEPVHPFGYQILSLRRLPIPPQQHGFVKFSVYMSEKVLVSFCQKF